MKTIKSLEFNLIRETLSNYATLKLNKEKIKNLLLINDKIELEKELNKTDEASRILKRHGRIIIEEVNDIYGSVSKATKGAILTIEELYDIKSCLRIVKENINFSNNIEKEEFPLFFSLINNFKTCNELNNALIKAIADNKVVKDEASSKLKSIRNDIRKLESQIKEKLLKLINTYSSILNDTNIIYKNGKQVLAVKSSEKNKLGGIVVDESNSGFTSYVEPEVVYKITSQINILRNEENEEIIRILTDLSRLVWKYAGEVNDDFYSLLELDFMFAKGEYGNNIDGKIANLNDNTLKLIGAKHPLIKKEDVISNDFYLSDDSKKILIISGPNTGGKSVALKTVGILSYMNQCGLMIPVEKEAILPVFDNIYVDIGDNQSIISSLSTFSSHISNIADILNNITSKSLVLLDEVGAGTDPKEGEALAMAIIDYCNKTNCFLLSSTHYENLKTFALNKEYVNVSSMEFDKVNLKPTYRLLKDQIGKSYALEISSRYGISKEIIEKAYDYKKEYSNSTEIALAKLENKLEEQNEIITNYNLKKEQLDNLIDENKKKEILLEKEIERIKKEAEKEIENLIKERKEEINQIYKDIKNKEDLKLHEALIANKKLEGFIKEEAIEQNKTNFNIGDKVMIISLSKVGEIVNINKNKYGVNIGNLTLNVDGSDLQIYQLKSKPSKVTINSKVKTTKMSLELNLIGKRVEEALIELQTYIDKARVMHLPSVRIIHGYGTGRLQKAVHDYLKQIKNIEYHFGGEHDGGMGSTTVIFEKKVK